MRFVSSIISAMIVSILLMLWLGFLLKCEHTNQITSFSFEPTYSTAASGVETVCEECNQGFSIGRFRGNPIDDSYIPVVEKYLENHTFVAGEYNTITASMTRPDYDSTKTQIACKIREGDVAVYFDASFKEEYASYLDSLSVGDEVTFRGKCSDTGFYWTDCEIITQ